jgi:hypothetical protein
MPHDHTLRIYLQFDSLFLTDLRGLLGDLEKAFNTLEAARLNRRGMRRSDRLTVSVFQTGQSLTVLVAGGAGLVALANIAKKVAEAREALWKSEESKWKAKAAKLDYQQKEMEAQGRRTRDASPEENAREILESRMEKIETATHITSIEIEVDGKVARIAFEEMRHTEIRQALPNRASKDNEDEKHKKELPPPKDTEKEK